MLYPAELRAREGSLIRTGKSPPADRSEAGMAPAILADIGGRALVALHAGWAVIVGESAGLRAGAVIVQIADRVGQRIGAPVAVVMAGLGQRGGDDHGRQQASGGKKLHSFHHDTPLSPAKTGSFWADPGPILRNFGPKVRKNGHIGDFSSDLGYLTNCQHSPARVLRLGPVLDWQFRVTKAVPVTRR